jgi:PTEN phosphatase family protein
MNKYDKFSVADAQADSAELKTIPEEAAAEAGEKSGAKTKIKMNGNEFDNPLMAASVGTTPAAATTDSFTFGNGFATDPFPAPNGNGGSGFSSSFLSNGSSISGPEVDIIEPATEDSSNRGFVNPLATSEHMNGSSSPMTAATPTPHAYDYVPEEFNPRTQQAAAKGGSDVKFDQIEVSLVDDAGAGELKEVLGNATDFFVENNNNYSISWDEAAYKISELEDDPARPPVPGWNLPYVRWCLRRIIESIWFRVITMLLILFDICVVIADLATEDSEENTTLNVYGILDLVLTIYFVIEIVLRIVALTYPVFFSTWYNVVDFAVVLVTFIVVCVAAAGNGWAETLSIFTVLRFVRIFRFIRLYTEKKQIETAARQLVSQNKRRYQQGGYDLDLTYVTARVIATSFPSSGMWSLYRNPIEKVAAFLDSTHPGKYRLYNLCSEKTYETRFFHERVERFMIDDHNVPSLDDMKRFAESVKAWLSADPDNVIVVHCKGGKGRTGTMICVWLVEAGVFTNAEQSLEYFGQRRTDTNVGNKFQGVETPSQSRYVGYYEVMRNRFGGTVPTPVKVSLKCITIRGMMYVGQGNGDDFWFTVNQGRSNQVFSAHLGFRRNCAVSYNPERDILKIGGLANCPQVEGDVRILFQTSSRTVPKGYENCPFYFWFNTSLLEGSKLVLNREDLDNPHKAKTWHCFRQSFQIEIEFETSK